MDVNIEVKIKMDKGKEIILKDEEARELFLKLKGIYEKEKTTEYVPWYPYYPNAPFYPVTYSYETWSSSDNTISISCNTLSTN